MYQSDEDLWPGVTQLPDYKSTFPHWVIKPLGEVISGMDPSGLDLLAQTLVYEPSRRVSAKAAMNARYFDDLDKTQFTRAAESGLILLGRQPRFCRLTN